MSTHINFSYLIHIRLNFLLSVKTIVKIAFKPYRSLTKCHEVFSDRAYWTVLSPQIQILFVIGC